MSNKTKKIIGFSLLLIILVVIKLFLGGFLGGNLLDELIPEILLLLIISFILMIVPLNFKLANKKRLNYKKGKIICLLNSIILFIIFSIKNLFIIYESNNSTHIIMNTNPFPKSIILGYFIIAIIYYFINMCFFVDNKE